LKLVHITSRSYLGEEMYQETNHVISLLSKEKQLSVTAAAAAASAVTSAAENTNEGMLEDSNAHRNHHPGLKCPAAFRIWLKETEGISQEKIGEVFIIVYYCLTCVLIIYLYDIVILTCFNMYYE